MEVTFGVVRVDEVPQSEDKASIVEGMTERAMFSHPIYALCVPTCGLRLSSAWWGSFKCEEKN